MAKTKKRMITIIHADGSPDGVLYEEPTLGTLQAAVGGFIEPLGYFKSFNGRKVIKAYCNEEGKVHGLPQNVRATLLWRSVYVDADYLVGDVAIVQMIPDAE